MLELVLNNIRRKAGQFETKLVPSDGANGDYFGDNISISSDGNTVIVGSYSNNDKGIRSGSAYVYDLTSL